MDDAHSIVRPYAERDDRGVRTVQEAAMCLHHPLRLSGRARGIEDARRGRSRENRMHCSGGWQAIEQIDPKLAARTPCGPRSPGRSIDDGQFAPRMAQDAVDASTRQIRADGDTQPTRLPGREDRRSDIYRIAKDDSNRRLGATV